MIESHSETPASLRLSRPIPALKKWAEELDYAALDPTDHGHIPFAVILVKEAEKWRTDVRLRHAPSLPVQLTASLIKHNGALPSTYAEKTAFKEHILSLKVKFDEENFEEAEAHAFRLWSERIVSSDVSALLDLHPLPNGNGNGDSSHANPAFHALLKTLKAFVDKTGALPLTSTLPDMKTDTESYVKLQRMYKEHARTDNVRLF